MGVRTRSYSDSAGQDLKNSNVPQQIVLKRPNLRGNSTNNVRSSDPSGFEDDLVENLGKFEILQKKWLKCILSVDLQCQNANIPVNKQMLFLNNAIKYTLKSIPNQHRVNFFINFLKNYEKDVQFISRLYVILIRLFFCFKYRFRLSEFPSLGCLSLFNNIFWSICSLGTLFTNFILTLCNGFVSMNDVVMGLVGYKSEIKSDNPLYISDEEILKLFPLFSEFHTNKFFCSFHQDFTTFLLKLYCKISVKMDNDGHISDELIWKINEYEINTLTDVNVYIMMLDFYSKVSLKTENLKDSSFLNGLVTIYSNLLKQFNTRDKMSNVVARGIIYSFSRFLTYLFPKYYSISGVPDSVLILIQSYLIIEQQNGVDNVDETVFESLKSVLKNHEVGREILKNLRINFNWYSSNLSFEAELNEYINNIYKSILKSSGIPRTVILYPTTSLTNKIEESYVNYELSKEVANKFLNSLFQHIQENNLSISALVNVIPSTGNLHYFIYLDIGLDKSGVDRSSVITCVLVSMATLMNDGIFVDGNSDSLVRVIIKLNDNYAQDSSLYKLFLSLLYCEIKDDTALSLEYRNYELYLYRTLVVHYLSQLVQSPVRLRDFTFDGKVVEEKMVTVRMFKMLNFRTNYLLMDRIVFEKYLTTRYIPVSDAQTMEDEVDSLIFGFLEYDMNNTTQEQNNQLVKSEDFVQNNANFDNVYFFKVILKFITQFRYNSRNTTELVELLLYKYHMKLCSNNYYDVSMTNRIYSNIKKLVETNLYGRKVKNSLFVQYFGSNEDSDDLIESNESINGDHSLNHDKLNSTSGSVTSTDVQLIELLKLNNRYTKRVFYTLTHIVSGHLVAFLPSNYIPTLLCNWASSLPIDTTSAVKSEKIAIARFILFLLLSQLLSFEHELSLKMFTRLEPIISAINVIYINLEIIHKGPKPFAFCEVISDEDEIYTPERFNFLSQETIELDDSNFYENLVNSYNTLREDSLKKFNERKENIKKRNKEQVQLLLQISVLISQIFLNIILKLYNTISDVNNGLITVTGIIYTNSFILHYLQNKFILKFCLDDGVVLSCIGKKRSLYYNSVEFLLLIDNTLSTMIRTCILSTLNLEADTVKSDPQNITVKLEDPLNHSIKNNTSKESVDYIYKEKKYSELINKIKIFKESIKSKLTYFNSFQNIYNFNIDNIGSTADSMSSGDVGNDTGNNAENEMEDGFEEDLEDFIDFETDSYLSMITYNTKKHTEKYKNMSVKKKLKMTILRNEWKSIIKSHLM
ncbi:uncharacterized protein TA16865 [Theileria annulata]|uniref:Uncharacterized protein n=1 Tax=Theileria annulata TaxID=5874 RepID=Q4UIL1_THEAN|nr:uncharacterized protein TA16865 [Theileria annulata]CAI73078.1 hypothetical protein TA16865 [Theileria annulata]|eukprot:XP_953756.1 hypothetical protein TA16865 [Theileria annulata]